MGSIYKLPVVGQITTFNTRNPTTDVWNTINYLRANALQTDVRYSSETPGLITTVYRAVTDGDVYLVYVNSTSISGRCDSGYIFSKQSGYNTVFFSITNESPAHYYSTFGSYSTSYPPYLNTFAGPSTNSTYATTSLDVYYSTTTALVDIQGYFENGYPIVYNTTNASAPNAPSVGIPGNTITVPVQFPAGYGLANPSDIYVTNNGTIIASNYNNGILTFVMPEP